MPDIHSTARIAASAIVTGDVTIGANSRVLHGAVINSDLGAVDIPRIIRRASATMSSSGATLI